MIKLYRQGSYFVGETNAADYSYLLRVRHESDTLDIGKFQVYKQGLFNIIPMSIYSDIDHAKLTVIDECFKDNSIWNSLFLMRDGIISIMSSYF